MADITSCKNESPSPNAQSSENEYARTKQKLYERIARAEREYQSGHYSDGPEFTSEIRERFNL